MLKQHRRPFTVGTAKDVYMSYQSCCHEAATDKYIKLRIQYFDGYEHMDSEASQLMTVRYYDHHTNFNIPDEYYEISQDSLPCANDIIRCCPDLIHVAIWVPLLVSTRPFAILEISTVKRVLKCHW